MLCVVLTPVHCPYVLLTVLQQKELGLKTTLEVSTTTSSIDFLFNRGRGTGHLTRDLNTLSWMLVVCGYAILQKATDQLLRFI